MFFPKKNKNLPPQCWHRIASKSPFRKNAMLSISRNDGENKKPSFIQPAAMGVESKIFNLYHRIINIKSTRHAYFGVWRGVVVGFARSNLS